MSTQTTSLSDELHQYLLDVSLHEPPVMQRLREMTMTLPERNMQIAPEQGQFMTLLLQIMGARRCIEIGTFTGYSTLAIARGIPGDGEVLACDISEKWTDMAQPYWRESGVADRIRLRIAPAVETLRALLEAGEAGQWDFAFIDADKTGYREYCENCLQLLRPGGVIAVDNTLWHGNVVDQQDPDTDTRAIRAFNEALHRDERVDISLVPIGDGLTLARKK